MTCNESATVACRQAGEKEQARDTRTRLEKTGKDFGLCPLSTLDQLSTLDLTRVFADTTSPAAVPITTARASTSLPRLRVVMTSIFERHPTLSDDFLSHHDPKSVTALWNLIENLSGFTHSNESVRNFFYPIFTRCHDPSMSDDLDQLLFDKAFDRFLESAMPRIAFKSCTGRGEASRPQTGSKATIFISSDLVSSFLKQFSQERNVQSTLAYAVLLANVLWHETAHAFGFTLSSGLSPLALTVPGYKEILRAGTDSADADARIIERGEGGRIVEDNLMGGILYGVYSGETEGYDGLLRLQLKLGQKFYP